MDNHVVKESRWEKDEPVVKIEISLRRTTPKTRTLIADSDTPWSHPIDGRVVSNPLGDTPTSFFFVGAILRLVPFHKETARMSDGTPIGREDPVFMTA
jgi:hypothetical protein